MLEILNKYYSDGLLYKQVHPMLSLTIWNYSEKVQYENLWDEITMMCRGLVTDNEGNIVARPFKKFFNVEEAKHTSTEDFQVYDKMDGSLIISFYYNDELIVASRGSFTSEQAVAAKKLLAQKYDTNNGMLPNYTYLFELIAPWNRIVVDYGNVEKLVVLGVIETKTGKEVEFSEMANEGFEIVKKYDGIKDYSTLKSTIKDNEEGFIVRFSNGDRVKIKGAEYLRLHKIMTNVSTTGIWEMLKNGDDVIEILKDVPDEFYNKIKSYIKELKYFYYSMNDNVGKKFDYFMYGKYNDKDPIKDKKVYAEWVLTQPKHLQPILFRMFDKRDYSDIMWKLIKPKFRKL
jgi:T4 RnlA family RNA ligase